MSDDLFADGIDGVHGLRRRERTRLWFRSMPPADIVPEYLRTAIQHAADVNAVTPELLDAVNIYPFTQEEPAADEPAFDLIALVEQGEDVVVQASPKERQTRILRRLGMNQIAPVADETPSAMPIYEPLTDWRTVPANAPTLLLADSPLLDGRKPGPILGPGGRFRVFSTDGGIVGLEVELADGSTSPGFCNAVDMTCVDPMIAELASGRKKVSTKERLRKVTRGLSQVTGTLMGSAF